MNYMNMVTVLQVEKHNLRTVKVAFIEGTNPRPYTYKTDLDSVTLGSWVVVQVCRNGVNTHALATVIEVDECPDLQAVTDNGLKWIVTDITEDMKHYTGIRRAERVAANKLGRASIMKQVKAFADERGVELDKLTLMPEETKAE